MYLYVHGNSAIARRLKVYTDAGQDVLARKAVADETLLELVLQHLADDANYHTRELDEVRRKQTLAAVDLAEIRERKNGNGNGHAAA